MKLAKGWEWKKLGEVCEINPPKGEIQELDENTAVSFIPMASVSEQGKIIKQEERGLKDVIKGFTYFRKGDVLIAKITPCFENGKRALTKGLKHNVGFGTTEFHVLRPKKAVIAEWIFYVISSSKFRKCGENNMTGTAGQKRIPKQFLENYQIPVPPLPIQQKIVSILERAESLKQKRELANEEANKIIQSIFYEMFGNPITNENGWDVATLGEIGKISMCKRIFKEQTLDKGDIPFYKIGTFGKEPDAFISTRVYEEYKQKFSFPKKGDILLSASGTIGRRVVYDGKPAYFQDSNIVWVDNNERKIINGFLYYVYGFIKWQTDTSTIARLYNKNLIKTRIIIPPLRLQNQFASIVEKIESIKQKQSQATVEISMLFDALMQKAFKGELVK